MGQAGRLVRRNPSASLALVLVGVSWSLLWSQDSYWNPLFFTGLWVGAALFMYAKGHLGYPGFRRHLQLSAASIPVWWWFEWVNARVGNWEYSGAERYGSVEYFILASIAFSTVIPALHSAWRLLGEPSVPTGGPLPYAHRLTWSAGLVATGVTFQVLVFASPTNFFPLVWVAPFLVLDGIVSYLGGQSLVFDLLARRPGVALRVALAGLLCGVFWEFWNYWATPKWVYHVPMFSWGHVFEMPLLGYGGYIPFSWAIYQLVRLGRVASRKVAL